MNQFINFLAGKKTYITAFVSVVTGLIAYFNGRESFTTAVQNVPGLLVFLGVSVASVRAAIAKVEAALSAKV